MLAIRLFVSSSMLAADAVDKVLSPSLFVVY
jgi:hypothetical protein